MRIHFTNKFGRTIVVWVPTGQKVEIGRLFNIPCVIHNDGIVTPVEFFQQVETIKNKGD